MHFPFYQIDAFTQEAFKGNPAGVILLQHWPEDSLLQKIATENNLPETAFLVPSKAGYDIRWFSPSCEIELCGHATLASAYVIFNKVAPGQQEIIFQTRTKGILSVHREAGTIVMDFPRISSQLVDRQFEYPDLNPQKAYEADKLLLVLSSAEEVEQFEPDFARLSHLHPHAVGITAWAGQPDCDFVSRCFAPNLGINEDPVTGSMHCALVDLWKQERGQLRFKARQLSARSGQLDLELINDRVLIRGHAKLVIEGTFQVS